MSSEQSEPKIIVDEDWKSRVEREREELRKQQAPSGSSAAEQRPPDERQQPPPRLPPATFAGLVSSLASQAAAALHDVAVPPQDSPDEQRLDPQLALELARHMIDTLGVLETKTRGNLTAEEDGMLQQALHELRIAFIEVQKQRR